MVSSSSISALVAFVFAAAELSSASPIAFPLTGTKGAESRLYARGQSCNKKADCNNVTRPRNSFSQCKNNVCTFQCSTGYFWNANTSLCQMKSYVIASSAAAAAAATRGPIPNPKAAQAQAWSTAPETPTTTDTTAPSPTPASSDESYMVDAKIASNGITGFNAQSLGWNTNAIMSWFRTDSTQDSTNGHSWCYNVYNNSQPGFAPDVSVMLANFQWSNTLAGAAYCGLEAEFVLPSGKTTTLILLDGFDPKWVKTPSSIDVIYDTFMNLWGTTMDDKNNVFQGVKWRFTGRRDSRYLFNTLN